MKFRKKPVVIEAVQWFPGVEHEAVRGANPNMLCGCVTLHGSASAQPHIHTMHAGQIVVLESGDWIIPEFDGKHFYPCKPDIFEATYEAVEE